MSQRRPLRIVFAGTPDFAAHYLQLILDQNIDQVIGVYTQPDRPAGRGKNPKPSPVKQLATSHDIPVFQPPTLKNTDAVDELRALQPDVMLVVAYGLILPKTVLDTPALGCINVHASLLPKWRGAAPIQRAIESGDHASGVTIMQMDEGLDTGDMINWVTCPITPEDTSGSLHDKLAAVGEQPLLDTLEQLSSGRTTPVPQDDALNTYAPKITKEEAKIDWSLPAEVIARRVRAFNPVPVAFTPYRDGLLRVHEATDIPGDITNTPPGTIVEVSNEGIDIATGSGLLRIQRLQLPGKRAMDVTALLNGNKQLFTSGVNLAGEE